MSKEGIQGHSLVEAVGGKQFLVIIIGKLFGCWCNFHITRCLFLICEENTHSVFYMTQGITVVQYLSEDIQVALHYRFAILFPYIWLFVY